MKRLLFAVAVAVLLAPATDVVFGKGHVPAHKEQVCHRGRVLAVGQAAVNVGLIRFRGHRPKGGYDGQNGIKAGRETSATTVL